MFLLVTGASGAGKSTVRRRVKDDLAPEQVADRVSVWCRRALAGEAPVLYPRGQ
jgi:guanylate kinase